MKHGWGLVGAFLVLLAASVWAANYTVSKDRALYAVCAAECAKACQKFVQCEWKVLNKCSQQCIQEPWKYGPGGYSDDGRPIDAETEAEVLVKDCNKCFASGQCRPLHYGDKFSAVCNAVRAQGRDLEEFFYNFYVHGRDDGCPANASLSVDGKKCECEGQFDDLHTVCLDPKTVKENLKRLVSSIPDDVMELMVEHAPDEIKSLIKYASRGDTFLVPGLDSMMSELIYAHFVHNTRNLRQLLNALGPERTQQLVDLLQSVLKKGESMETPPQPPYTPPAEQPPYYPPTEQPPTQPPLPPVKRPPVELPPAQPPEAACSFMGTWNWVQGSLKVGRAEVTGSNQGFQASVFNEYNNIPGAVAYLSGSFDDKAFTMTGSIAEPYTVRGNLSTSSDCTYFQLVPTGGTSPSGSETSTSILNSIGISSQYFEFRKGE